MADWDDDEFEPEDPNKVVAPVKNDKWEGEDEDDDVKDAWDADSDEEKKEDEPAVKAVQKKKKKKLADILAEKEEAKQRELEEEQKKREEELLNSTPEAKQAEKLRLQRLEEERERELAREMIGLSTEEMSSGLNFKPTTQEEFDSLRTGLLEKLQDLESSDLYAEFAFSLLSGMCTNLNIPTLKKVKSEAEAFISAKLKEEKANKGKKGKPAKATIRMETDRSMFGRGLDDGYNDMDDFM